MIYVIRYMRAPVATLTTWDGVVLRSDYDQGRYQWTVGKKVPDVLKWFQNHQHVWDVSHPH